MHPTLAQWVEASLHATVSAAEPLLVEASNRRFYRVRLAVSSSEPAAVGSVPTAPGSGPTDSSSGPAASSSRPGSFVVMESPPQLERNDAFVAVQKLLANNGQPVAPILAMDLERGFFLLGDLGERHLEDVYGGPLQDSAIALAIDNLVALQQIDAPDISPYLESRFRDELGIFVEWFLGALLGEPLPEAAADAFEALIDNAVSQPRCLIHRDYHCRNLLVRQNGGLGIVDFQDALIGPATYDLACLLWDCYHEFDDGDRRRWQRYYERRSRFSFPGGTLSETLDLTGLQRQIKAIGIFARLKLRDGKPAHLRYIVPVLQSAMRISLTYPGTVELGHLLKEVGARASRALH